MDTIAVWFSCGAASAVAAKKTIEKYGSTHHIRVLNNPIVEEHEDNQRFLRDCEAWLGVKIEHVVNSKYPNHSIKEVFDKRKYMSGIAGAPCTLELKKKARQEWESKNEFHHTVLGFTADEVKRHERFCLTEREILPVLIELGLTKEDCFRIITEAGIKLPKVYELGMPNANCIGCVKSTGTGYWDLIRRVFPKEFKERCEQSRRIKCRLIKVKGKRVFLDELPLDIKPRKIKVDHIECGIFCEERI